MISPIPRRLPNTKQWFRVADEKWDDPLDPSFAQRYGGRWNPPGSFPSLYLNEDIATARGQIYRMLEGSPVHPEDLDRFTNAMRRGAGMSLEAGAHRLLSK